MFRSLFTLFGLLLPCSGVAQDAESGARYSEGLHPGGSTTTEACSELAATFRPRCENSVADGKTWSMPTTLARSGSRAADDTPPVVPAAGVFDGDVLSSEVPLIRGALDHSLVDAVLSRHSAQIRYCYERERPRTPGLEGRVVIRFTIANDGSVSQAAVTESTMNNETVESCLSGRFMRMAFPEPRGGGIVIVSYPLVFSPG